jgi:hypothetical protein
MRRAVLLALSASLLAIAFAGPATGATVRRQWSAPLGSDARHGRISLVGYTDGTGSLSAAVKALRPDTSYAIRVRAGSCRQAGTLLYDGGRFTTDGNGNGAANRRVSLTRMNAIWGRIRSYTVSVRLIAGDSVECGHFYFAKATRIVIPGYRIDLPVIVASGYPKCGVAMYLKELSQPREPGVTYLYAHARIGMFLPLLEQSRIAGGTGIVGREVRVYTSDSQVVTYRIDRVRRHVSSIQNAVAITAERLWIQTSEGPNFTYPKLVLEAHRVAVAPASFAAAHPTPHPRSC